SGRKTELLEGGLRIPAIVSWPAVLPKNKTSEQVAISMDWLPTLLDAVGADPDPAFVPDGISLLPMLRGDSAPVRRTLYWRYKGNAQRAVRDGDFKYLKIRENTFLFNVADDPMERANLKDRQPEVFERLAKEWSIGTRRCCLKCRTATRVATTRIGGRITSDCAARRNQT